jgi:hypothetical protein
MMAGLVFGSACGGSYGSGAPSSPSESSAPASTSQPVVSSPSPSPTPTEEPSPDLTRILDFAGPAVGGGQIRGEDYAGQDVVLWFFAPW